MRCIEIRISFVMNGFISVTVLVFYKQNICIVKVECSFLFSFQAFKGARVLSCTSSYGCKIQL
jgi:hypothetical protein